LPVHRITEPAVHHITGSPDSRPFRANSRQTQQTPRNSFARGSRRPIAFGCDAEPRTVAGEKSIPPKVTRAEL
jgi:hypothetical protein